MLIRAEGISDLGWLVMTFRDTKSRKDVSATISQGHRFSKSKASVYCTRRSKNFGCWASLSRLRFEATSIFFLFSSALYPIMPSPSSFPLSSSPLSPLPTVHPYRTIPILS